MGFKTAWILFTKTMLKLKCILKYFYVWAQNMIMRQWDKL